MNQQGIPYIIPLWAFIGIVFAPALGLFVAEVLIWFRKNKNKY
jgi:hypothetical protein